MSNHTWRGGVVAGAQLVGGDLGGEVVDVVILFQTHTKNQTQIHIQLQKCTARYACRHWDVFIRGATDACRTTMGVQSHLYTECGPLVPLRNVLEGGACR